MKECLDHSGRQATPDQSFFKYVPASTGRIILGARTLRWSSPLLFNDPFDVPRRFASDISAQDLANACARTIEQLVLDPPVDCSHLKAELQVIAQRSRGVALAGREQLRSVIASHATEFQAPSGGLDAMRELWASLVPAFRILCLSEQRDIAPLWAHYAANYSGIVLEFKAVQEVDSPLLEARRVTYRREKPRFYTAAGQAEIMMMPTHDACRTLMRTATLIKSEDWSYEREWRVVSHSRPGDTGHYFDYRFHPSELQAVYFGPNMQPTDRSAIETLLREHPSTQTFDVSIGCDREFSFRETS